MDSPPPPLPAKTRRSGQHAPVIVSATRHQHQHQPHVVKIRVNPVEPVAVAAQSGANTVRISITGSNRGSSGAEYPTQDDMRGGSPYYFYTSGQSSPSDTLDSGTCSDLDGSTPPPLPKKGGVTVTVNRISHQRGGSLTSSGAEVESDDEISCDSLNSSELDKQEESAIEPVIQESNLPETVVQDIRDRSARGSLSPEHDELHRVQERVSRVSLTQDEPEIIRDLDERALFTKPPESLGNSFHTNTLDDHKPLAKKVSSDSNSSRKSFVEERTYEERKKNDTTDVTEFNPDNFYKFHLNEKNCESDVSSSCVEDVDYFAGCKGYLECGDPAASTIRSSKGTIRGVKNRVRAGIATFLQMHDTKTWAEREAGTVVVYTTTMGIVRSTYQRCLKVRQILRTHLVKFDERDVFMSRETQAEIRDRMHSDEILVPQVFIEGQYIGDAEVIERLNETGELRRILKPYKSADACTTCQVCGGYRLLPCAVCNGSKKSVHRNHFTTELVALKCMNCDEVGLVKCYAC